MAVTTNKTVLFLIGGVAAAAVVAYAAGVLGPAKQPPEAIVTAPQPEPEAVPADQKDARLPAPETPAEAAPATPDAAAAPEPEPPAQAGPAPVVPPSFDVVRLEGDGSIVIAGKAAAGATVDLLVGSNVIGSAVAGAEGDFAVVLDDPLKPGDYQIVLRATAPDKVVAMSVETAVVSVPATPDGQVLALVEEPGKPSQMIVLPKPEKPAEAAKPAPEAPAPETPAAAETPAPAESQPAGEMQAALPEQPQAEPAAPAQPAPAQPAAPSGPTVRVQAVEIDGSKIFVAGVADPGRTVRGYANEILLGDAKASPDGQFLIEADRALAVGDYIIRVDALEPDGVKVAARAAVPFEREPGETIAAVAPEPELATPPATPPAAPAVEAPAATAPAASPEQSAQPPAAAEAPQQPATPPANTESSATPPAAASDAPATEAPADPTTQPPAAVADAPAAADAPEAPAATPEPAPEPQAQAAVAETPAAAEPEPTAPAAESATPAPSAPEPSQQAAVEEPAAAEPQPAEPEAAQPAAEQPAAPAAEATAPPAAAETPAAPPAAEASVPVEPAAETPASPPAVVETQPDQPLAAEPPASAATETAPAPEPAPDVASAPDLPAPPASDGVGEVLAPKLQSVDSAVIIRRGDTLWRISRRVYGRGVRYSTIYLANQSQIEDPDRIWPGQVFKVPEKSNDGKAEADYSRLGNRLTTIPKDGGPAADGQQ